MSKVKKKEQTPQERAEAFHNWMLNRVKSIHMANNAKMSEAYQKIYAA